MSGNAGRVTTYTLLAFETDDHGRPNRSVNISIATDDPSEVEDAFFQFMAAQGVDYGDDPDDEPDNSEDVIDSFLDRLEDLQRERNLLERTLERIAGGIIDPPRYARAALEHLREARNASASVG